MSSQSGRKMMRLQSDLARAGVLAEAIIIRTLGSKLFAA